MSGSDSSDPFEKAPFKKPGTMLNLHFTFEIHLCY